MNATYKNRDYVEILSIEDYERGFADGVAHVRKSPLIVINWSTLANGLINLACTVAIIFTAMLIGEMRGMKSDDRLNITFSDGSTTTQKTGLAPAIRGANGSTVVMGEVR